MELDRLVSVVFNSRRKTGRVDLEAIEVTVRSAFHRAGAAALTELLQFPRPPPIDATSLYSCGRQARYRELRPKTLLTAVGKVEFPAERFHNRASNFAMLRAPHVTGFVMRHARQLSPVRAGVDGNGAPVVLPILAPSRSNCDRPCWLLPHGPQLVAFHTSEVSACCHGGTDSGVLRSQDIRWQGETMPSCYCQEPEPAFDGDPVVFPWISS